MRPSYQSASSAFQHGPAAAAGRASAAVRARPSRAVTVNSLSTRATLCCGCKASVCEEGAIGAGWYRRRTMRAVRDLPLAAPLVLAGLAVFFGGGPLDGPVAWLGGGALATLLLLAATRGIPGGFLSVVPLVVLAVWCAVSISWSWLPDRSWDYANRALLYALFAALGLWFAGRARLLAGGLAVIVFAVCGWSLLGKVLPPVYDYGGFDVTARLTGPVGLWNQLALMAVFGLVLALVFRRSPGALLAYVAGVTLLLTYSRGGLLTAAIVLTVWLALSDERIEGGTLLVASGLPAAAAVGIAFLLPGVTSDHQPSSTRWHDGLVFGAVLLVGAAVALVLDRRL